MLSRRERVELDVTGRLTEVAKLVGARQPDLLLLNDDDLTFAKIRLDPRSLETVTTSIGTIREPLPRALCWAAAWDMTRDAEMRARDYLRLVLGGVRAESEIGVVQSLLQKAYLAVNAYGDPPARRPGVHALTDTSLRLLREAQPGSDVQLVYAQTFALAEEPDQLDLIEALLSGTEWVDGLALDTELRWHLLIHLAAKGRAGEPEINAELERDPTAAGEKRAATARAARPDPAAKEAAWSAVMDTDTLSNHLQAATMAQFWRYDQVELCRPYVERYFEQIADIWRTRSMDTAHTITEMLYPAVVIEQATVDRTDRYLAESDPQPALRRMLSEGRDSLARALRARARDAADG